MSQNIILRIIDVTKRFGDFTAIDKISLDVYDGELLVLLGPSGSGKSTLLRIIDGLEKPDEGRIYLDGEDITHLPPYKRDIAMVFQDLALFPHMTVFDNVAYGLKIRRLPKREIERRVIETLEMMQIEWLSKRKVTQLSGGQRQRVALARSLVLRPKVLLLDEPLGALDLKLRKEMHIELTRLHREVRNTWIFVTHDQEEALTLADRIGILNNGRLIQIGDKWDVYEKPNSLFVADFIGDINILECIVKGECREKLFADYRGKTLIISKKKGVYRGDKVYLALRPELIKVSKSRPDSDKYNFFEGVVVDEIYKGNMVRYEVKIPSGEIIKVNVLSVDADYDINDRIYIFWKHGAGVLLLGDEE